MTAVVITTICVIFAAHFLGALKIGIIMKNNQSGRVKQKEFYSTIISSILNIPKMNIEIDIWRHKSLTISHDFHNCTSESEPILLNLDPIWSQHQFKVNLNRNSKNIQIFGGSGKNILDEMMSYAICQICHKLFRKNDITIIHSRYFYNLSVLISECLSNNRRRSIFEDISKLDRINRSNKYFQTVLLANQKQTMDVLKKLNIESILNTSNWIILNLNNATQINNVLNSRYTIQLVLSFLDESRFTFSHGNLMDPRSISEDEQASLDNLLLLVRAWKIGLDKNIVSTNKSLCSRNGTRRLDDFIGSIRNIIKSSLMLSVLENSQRESMILFTTNTNNTVIYAHEHFPVNRVIPLNTTFKLCAPFLSVFFEKINPNGPFVLQNMRGFLSKIIKHLMETLDFSVELYDTPDGQYGARIENQTYFSGCIGEIQKGNMDIGAGAFTVISARQEVIDYTYPIMADPTVILYLRPTPPRKWWNAFKSLKMNIWIMVLIAIVTVPVVNTVVCKFNPFSAWNLKLSFAIRHEIEYKEHLWTSIGSFFNQGQDFYAYPISARFVLACWWIFSVIIMSVISAHLTSVLTLIEAEKLPRTLAELEAYKDIVLYTTSGTSSESILKASEDPVLKKLYSRSISSPLCIDIVENEASENAACTMELASANVLQLTNCSRYILLEEIIQSSYNAFVIPKNFKYKQIFNEKIGKLVDRGIITKWIKEDYNRLQQSFCRNNMMGSTDPIDTEGITGVYIVCVSVYMFGIVLLICELFIRKWL